MHRSPAVPPAEQEGAMAEEGIRRDRRLNAVEIARRLHEKSAPVPEDVDSAMTP